MAGHVAGRRIACILAGFVVLWGYVDRAEAIDAFDKRIEAHGFVEIQVRGLNRSYDEEFDLAQWYNVLNLELEFEILPDGWGPFDLLEAYIRAEGRYDCIYTGGCGMFPSVNTYGNSSRDLPLRLRNAWDQEYAGVINANSRAIPPRPVLRVDPEKRDPVGWSVAAIVKTETGNDPRNPNTYSAGLSANCPPTGKPSNQTGLNPNLAGCVDNRPTHTEITKREGFPGFDTLFDSKGADSELHEYQDYAAMNAALAPEGKIFYDERIKDENFSIPASGGYKETYGPLFRGLADARDDPAFYTLKPVIDWKFTFRSFPGAVPNGTTLPMGPWLPKNFFKTLAALDDRANPLRARNTPTLLVVDGMTERGPGSRVNARDCETFIADCTGLNVDPFDPRLRQLEALSTIVGGFPNFYQLSDPTLGETGGQPGTNLVLGTYPNNSLFRGVFNDSLFGGDYSGIIPCWDTNKTIANRHPAVSSNSKFIDQLTSANISGPLGRFARFGCIPFTNVRVTGGEGELPMRVAPDFSNLSPSDTSRAQGLYYPSYGLRNYIERGGDFDAHEFNISETDRAWNRGASQRETYELKEAYLDMEFLDSRLWIRAGIQNIVWGKTELFRTTDQFNPQDFALASLPALEESRIALLSWRGVYSFYDVGPFEDLRFEFAMNFDRNKPVDLGACGEPYTLDIVCGLTLGTAIHSVTGLGVAGFDRPPSGWSDVDGLEFGGRLEFRWDRFSFAIVDFYGYSDFPFPNVLTYYERNVDPETNMPRKGGSTGRCENRAGFVATQVFGAGPAPAGFTETKLIHGGNSALEAQNPGVAAVRPVGLRNVTTLNGGTGEVTGFNNLAAANDDWWRRKEAYTLMGVGTDEACLKPGGAPGLSNENRFNPALAPSLAGYLGEPGKTISDYSDPSTDEFELDTYIALTVGNDGDDPQIQWTLADSSVDYALLHHPANQQLFTFICSATVSIAVALAPGACAWNLWGTEALLVQDFDGPPFGDLLSGAFAGNQTDTYYFNFYSTIVNATKGQPLVVARTVPLAPLNSDVRDGRTTSMDAVFGLNCRAPNGGTCAPSIFPGTNPFVFKRLKDTPRDVFDLLTLDNTLTWQQKSTLGCGPAYGTRCDSGAGVVRVRIKDCSGDSSLSYAADCDRYAALEDEIDIESERVARSQPALYEIVKKDGTPCLLNFGEIDPCRVFGRGGGIDFLNAEASVVLQSFVGFEGTEGRTKTPLAIDTWVTWAADTAQPGTIGVSGRRNFPSPFLPDRAPEPYTGGVVCTRYAPGSPSANKMGLVTLPGCRGATSATVDNGDPTNVFDNVIEVEFEPHYTPSVDGCVFGRSMTRTGGQTFWIRAFTNGEYDADLQAELYETCFNNNAAMIPGVDPDDPALPTGFTPVAGTETRDNLHDGDVTWFSYSRRPVEVGGVLLSQLRFGSGHLFHPLAQCEQAGTGTDGTAVWRPLGGGPTPESAVNRAVNLCQSTTRNFDDDFILGNASVFKNELAAISWNFAMFLVITSCNSVSGGDDIEPDLECFNQDRPWQSGRCSFSTPQFCRNVKGFLGVGGVGRNDPRAGGNPAFGRRDFLWQSGAELVLQYKQRNVFGISADFAEDNTKTNWGVEFTWIAATPWVDNNSLTSTTMSDTFNLTISVDRPTFINFLNANRTFFFNSQWFFNYIPEHSDGFTSFANPFNVLFTFAVFTGYYQDRLLPQLVTVYDFGSQSGGFLPQVGYRFTEAFSVTFGVSFFIGKDEYVPMPLRGFAPRANRAGQHKYEDGVQRLLANFMRRDEAWMRLRWTF